VIIADTNVVSEFMKDRPAESVMAWARELGAGEVTISVITVEEIERGLARLPSGHRRRELTRRWHDLVDAYADTVMTYDMPAAQATARILVTRTAAGHQLSLADAEIAGICLSKGCQIATRNSRDFAGIVGLTVINPFDR
jgi:predicted nucleic acid-binding protein